MSYKLSKGGGCLLCVPPQVVNLLYRMRRSHLDILIQRSFQCSRDHDAACQVNQSHEWVFISLVTWNNLLKCLNTAEKPFNAAALPVEFWIEPGWTPSFQIPPRSPIDRDIDLNSSVQVLLMPLPGHRRPHPRRWSRGDPSHRGRPVCGFVDGGNSGRLSGYHRHFTGKIWPQVLSEGSYIFRATSRYMGVCRLF